MTTYIGYIGAKAQFGQSKNGKTFAKVPFYTGDQRYLLFFWEALAPLALKLNVGDRLLVAGKTRILPPQTDEQLPLPVIDSKTVTFLDRKQPKSVDAVDDDMTPDEEEVPF